MTLEEKIKRAEEILAKHLTPKSVLFCSFGKDSMVCLDLVLRSGRAAPVIFNRIPVFSEKDNFANRMIAELGLRAYSYPPQAIGLSLRDHPEIIYYQSLGEGRTLIFPVGIQEPGEGQPFACGVELMTPLTGKMDFPWDVAIFGQKAVDHHFLFEDMTPTSAVVQVAEDFKMLFPILEFTDAEVWEYTERFHVPYNAHRYDRENGYREFEDIRFNNDHYYTCVRCLLPGADPIECPRGGLVPNRHASVPLVEIQPLPHMRSYGRT